MVLPANYFNRLFSKVNTEIQFIVTTMIWSSSRNLVDFLILLLAYPLIIAYLWFDPITPGGLTLTSKEIHLKIGGFVEGLVLGEDTDYGRKAIKAGAHYKFFFTPFAFHSPRRAREMGRVGLLWFWLKATFYVKRHGLKDVHSKFSYPYGHYKGDD
jgi:hypothetical protein